ncbi:ABC transporter permease [Streptomyces albipurpureus]|uniref:ABC transporter permease n=1 Tax=Streptomyces albipurpureus TaxID=2897419 RepID=A0ABT0ULN1_9ACTN|nr:ABC transporter permease [Streptomyces sp. CWNU-1]MCM2388929.1 ABC transporter permease [Streptomyces sp. CWNU-1]
MSTLTTTAAPSEGTATPGRSFLRGMTWVVWRRNRTGLLLLLGTTALFIAFCVYQRGQLIDFLNSPKAAELPGQLLSQHEDRLDNAFLLLATLPIILGVFLGGPLIAAEHENSTLRLTTTQSIARLRIILTTLAVPLLAITVFTTLMTVTFTWVWRSVDTQYAGGDWWGSSVINATGPLPVALSLFATSFGILAGAILRRSVAAMGLTFVVLTMATMTVKDRVASYFVTPHQFTYPLASEFTELKPGEIQVDNWVGTADGKLYGWGTCVRMTEAESTACVNKHGIVNNVVEYVKLDQLPGIQWSMTAVLLAMTIAMLAATVWWTHRKSL